jgi:hypothetical protein
MVNRLDIKENEGLLVIAGSLSLCLGISLVIVSLVTGDDEYGKATLGFALAWALLRWSQVCEQKNQLLDFISELRTDLSSLQLANSRARNAARESYIATLIKSGEEIKVMREQIEELKAELRDARIASDIQRQMFSMNKPIKPAVFVPIKKE